MIQINLAPESMEEPNVIIVTEGVRVRDRVARGLAAVWPILLTGSDIFGNVRAFSVVVPQLEVTMMTRCMSSFTKTSNLSVNFVLIIIIQQSSWL